MAPSDPASTDSLLAYRHKAVRDLAWLLRAPPLLSPSTGLEPLEAPLDDAAEASRDAIACWLEELDSDPEVLLKQLRLQPNVRRLGFYATALTEFWLRYGPGWGTQRLLASVPLASRSDPSGKQIAGQLKFVCRRPEEVLHVESSLKFFVDAIPAAELDVASGGPSMSRFVGPFLHENFSWRLHEARRKLQSTASSAVRGFLQAELGEAPVRSAYFLKGFIFRPLRDFRSCAPWSTPPELNGSCPRGWYTSSIDELEQHALPEARYAVLPKLFWLGPAEARGDPPALGACDLPGQEAPPPAEPWEQVRTQVEQHFEKHNNALLVCELLPMDGSAGTETRWAERSRGFILPKTWDPKALLTEGPTGMRTSSESRMVAAEMTGFADVRGQYSDRFADERRDTPPDLRDAEVRISGAAAPYLERPLVAREIAELVLGRWTSRERCARKLELRALLRAAEARETGAVCRLACEALAAIAGQGLRTAGHVVLELLWREGTLPAADDEALAGLFETGLCSDLCPRLVSRIFLRFGAAPPQLDEERAAEYLEAAIAEGDRHAVRGLVELLAAARSLRGAAVADRLAGAVDLLTSAPGDASVIDLVCAAAPGLGAAISEALLANGQHRLVRRIGAPAAVASPTADAQGLEAELPPLALPKGVSITLVTGDCPSALAELLRRIDSGGVVAVDAEWRPWKRRGARAGAELGLEDYQVQLLQLAWNEAVFVLDLPALGEERLLRILRPLLAGCVLVGYGLEGDVQRLADSFPACAGELEAPWRGIDLAALCSRLGRGGQGLRALCCGVLGGTLDKALQCSDWAARPLGQPQLEYAALDAWALLPLLRRLLLARECRPVESTGVVSMEDAEVAVDAVRGVATPMPALASAGAAGAASWLRRLGADPARARLAPHDGTREGPRVVVCKTLACVLEAETTRRLLCVLPLAAEVCLRRVAALAAGEGACESSACRLASACELRSVFRQPRGSVGPIGPALDARLAGSACGGGVAVLIEESLLRHGDGGGGADPILSCGGGAPLWHLLAEARHLQELLGATIGSFLATKADDADDDGTMSGWGQ